MHSVSDFPCPIGHLQGDIQVFGTDDKIKETDFYISSPANHSNKAVIIFPDVFGPKLSNSRTFADGIASQGYHCVIPDFFHGDPWRMERDRSEFLSWLGAITEQRLAEDFNNVVEYLSQKNVNRIALVGFCWGGRVCILFGNNPHVSAVVSFYPSRIVPEDISVTKVPTFIGIPEHDAVISPELIERINEAINNRIKEVDFEIKSKVYAGQNHGFVHRGEFSNPSVYQASEEAINDMFNWFTKYF